MSGSLSERYLAVEAAPDSDKRSGIVVELHMVRLKKILANGCQPNVMRCSPPYFRVSCPIGGYLNAGQRTDVSRLNLCAHRLRQIKAASWTARYR